MVLDVSIDLQFWQGISTSNSKLFTNGSASVAVTIFYAVSDDAGADFEIKTVGLDFCPVGDSGPELITSVERTPNPGNIFGSTMAWTTPPAGSYDPKFKGHNENQDLFPSVAFTASEKTYFITSKKEVDAENEEKNYLLGYVEVSVPDGESARKSLYFYTYMYATYDKQNYDFSSKVLLTRTHKDSLSFAVTSTDTGDSSCTVNDIDRFQMNYVKAIYNNSLPPTFEMYPDSSWSQLFFDHSGNAVDTEQDKNRYNKDLSMSPGTGMGGFACENYLRGKESRLTRLVGNGTAAFSRVEQLSIDDRDPNGIYTVNIGSPFVGSFAYYYIDHVANNNYTEFSGKADFLTTDMYGSCSELIVEGNIGSNNDDNVITFQTDVIVLDA